MQSSQQEKRYAGGNHRSAQFQAKIEQMALRLSPLVRLTSGEVHSAFPSTLLNYWLLTSEQCDELAHFYHQRTPSVWTQHYPCPVSREWRTDATLEEKRRRIGRFIGLRGCESPARVQGPASVQSEEEIVREMRATRAREDEEEALKLKSRWY